MELDDSIRPQKVTIYRGGTPRGGWRLGRNPRCWRPCCLGRQEAWPMGWAYLTQEEAQRTIEPNTLTAGSGARQQGRRWAEEAGA
jgi:hypothetical protein